MGGLLAFGFLAFGDGAGDGVEHLKGLVAFWVASGGVGVAPEEAFEVAGVDLFFTVFMVYLCGSLPVAANDVLQKFFSGFFFYGAVV